MRTERPRPPDPQMRTIGYGLSPVEILLAFAIAGVVGCGYLVCGEREQPEAGLTLPCKVLAVHDGDTCTVEIRVRCQVRLLGCWAPELRDPRGPAARDRLTQLAAGRDGLLEIPLRDARSVGDALSLSRVLGRVWVDGRDIGGMLVAEKLATKEKPKP